MSSLIFQFISLLVIYFGCILVFLVLCYLKTLIIEQIIHDYSWVFIINNWLIPIHCWHLCSLCVVWIISFIVETKIWTFHWLIKSIIYYVALGGHKEEWYIKFEPTNLFKTMNNIFWFIDNVINFGLAFLWNSYSWVFFVINDSINPWCSLSII